jgi:aspartate 4-decarboxylase
MKNKIKIFPTEGASAAIVYVFNSLKYNKLVGILTPIFSPYLEIPA